MRIAGPAGVFLVVMLLAAPAGAAELQPVAHPEEIGFAADRLQRVTDAFQGYVDNGRLPGAVVLIVRDDKVAYFRTFGWQDRDRKIAMRPDSIFRIASMTKPIVSVAAMTLAEDGKLDLAAPVAQYLPEFKDLRVGVEQRDPKTGETMLVMEPQKRPMTVQDLLRHTAGLVYGQFGDGLVHRAYRAANVGDRNETLAEMVTKLSKLPLAHQPGEVWEYSRAVDVLGRVIEVVSGTTLDRLVEERVTRPLGMGSTGFYVHEADLGRLAQAQTDPATGKRPVLPEVTKKPRLFSGGGGIVSTAGDYLKFCEMLLHHGEWQEARVLAPATVDLMTSDALPPGIGYSRRALTTTADIAPTPAEGQGFGLGFAVRTATGHNPLPGSIGTYYWTGAWGTTFWVDPKEHLIGIMMIQVPSGQGGPYRRAMRYLTYQALADHAG
ncbi:MAG TPA: serine hydrolase domain-containing protein [Stellaceae bacterium]|jgi:CubicO group peptidase (beta-lactamase class C family)